MIPIRPIFFSSWLFLLFVLAPAALTHASSLTVLHAFAGGQDGSAEYSGLVSSGDTLYGVTGAGGAHNAGTIYKVNIDGSGYTILYSFAGGANSDFPIANLAISGHLLFGTTRGVGTANGTVFRVRTDGTGFTTIHTFTGAPDGGFANSGLLIDGNTLYGATSSGGANQTGTIYKINTDGNGYAVLHSFGASPDGASPIAGLTLGPDALYGTTAFGGSYGYGTVFKISYDGTGYTKICDFPAGMPSNAPNGPTAPLILIYDRLYGTTHGGQANGDGSIFTINTDGSGYRLLHSFQGQDGSNPYGLLQAGNALYGTTQFGGVNDTGTIFRIEADGTEYSVLHSFGGTDGSEPYVGLTLAGDGQFFGTTSGALPHGPSGSSTIYEFSTPTWLAMDVAVADDDTAHIVWFNASNTLTAWNFNTSNQRTRNSGAQGPYVDFGLVWRPKAIKTAADGTSRVLMVRDDGAMAIYTLDTNGIVTNTGQTYGPYSSNIYYWEPTGLSVLSDGSCRVLWTISDGTADVWSLDALGYVTTVGPTYPPDTGSEGTWQAVAISAASDGTSRVLWNRPDGAMRLWTLDTTDSLSIGGLTYGPITDSAGVWAASKVSVDPSDGNSWVLWKRSDGAIQKWTFGANEEKISGGEYEAPLVDGNGTWDAAEIDTGPLGDGRILWKRSDGAMRLWSFDSKGQRTLCGSVYGPY